MGRPLGAQAFVDKLRAAGVSVVEHTVRGVKWSDHNRNAKGPWSDVNGVMIHHTGAYSSRDQIINYCWDGSAALPGPLCHGVIDKSGVVHLVGWGRANHAGGGDPAVLAHVVAENYTAAKELTSRYDNDDAPAVDGNAHFYGFELINNGSGKEAWPAAQLEATRRVAAVICRAHGWSERSVIAHREWQRGKPDPIKVQMGQFRADVAQLLRAGIPKPTPPAPPKPSQPAPTLEQRVADLARRLTAVEAAIKR